MWPSSGSALLGLRMSPQSLAHRICLLSGLVFVLSSNQAQGENIAPLTCFGTRTVPALSIVDAATTTEVLVDERAGTISAFGQVSPIVTRERGGIGFRGPAAVPGYAAKGTVVGWFDQRGGYLFVKLLPPAPNLITWGRHFYSMGRYHCERSNLLS
jgi:hypothetical protein